MTRVQRSLRRGAFGAGLALALGCTSYRSNVVQTDPAGDVADCKHLKGVPMTLKVPTHVQITITQTRYANLADDAGKSTLQDGGVVPATTPLKYGGQLHTTYDVDYSFIERRQLHTVDFKRPFSGSLLTAVGFGAGTQNITSVANSVNDTTITDVTAAITAVLTRGPALKALLGRPTGGGGEAAPKHNIYKFTDVVAVEMFDVHDPQLEQKVQAFVDAHLNACTPPCAGPACVVPAGR